MRVTTRRLLEEHMAVVVIFDSGQKDDGTWHVPQNHALKVNCMRTNGVIRQSDRSIQTNKQ